MALDHNRRGRLDDDREDEGLDDKEFPQPTGELETLEADSLVLALGQDVDLTLLNEDAGIVIENVVVRVGPDMMTGRPGVFAGGDMAPPNARGHRRRRPRSRRPARCVDAYLRSAPYVARPSTGRRASTGSNAWYYEDAPPGRCGRRSRRCAGSRI